MERTSTVYKTYVEILKRELVCAMGCTEPIAIACCAAVARKALGTLPSEIDVAASGNIIKNVKSVIVPNTGGLRGIEAAAAIGALAAYISDESVTVFQPMNVNFGILTPLARRVKGKANKNLAIAQRSLAIIDQMTGQEGTE